MPSERFCYYIDAPIKYFQSFVVSPASGGGNNKKNKIK